jgi:hypothetical protein
VYGTLEIPKVMVRIHDRQIVVQLVLHAACS